MEDRVQGAHLLDIGGVRVEQGAANGIEVLDLTTRPSSEYVGLRFRDMPIRGAMIGAIVRDGRAVFPRSDEVLQAGDRVIVFTETKRVPDVERVL